MTTRVPSTYVTDETMLRFVVINYARAMGLAGAPKIEALIGLYATSLHYLYIFILMDFLVCFSYDECFSSSSYKQ